MSVTVRARHEYRHPLSKVWAAFSDPGFYEAKFAGIGHRRIEIVSAERNGDNFTIEVDRQVPVDAPPMLRGLLGDWITLLQSEHWHPAGKAGYVNALQIAGRGVPAVVSGAMRLSGNDQHCVNEVEITIRSSVPLLGGKLEQLIAHDTEATLAAEHAFIEGYLDQA